MQARVVRGTKETQSARDKKKFCSNKMALYIYIANSKTDRQLKDIFTFLRNPFPGNAWIYNKNFLTNY